MGMMFSKKRMRWYFRAPRKVWSYTTAEACNLRGR